MSISSYQKTIISTFILVVSLFPVCTSGRALERKRGMPSPTTANRSYNDQLLAAASPFEDLTEYALAGNKEGVAQALKTCDEQASRVNRLLSPKAREQLTVLVSAMKQAQAKGNNEEIALKAVAAYRVIIESLDTRSLTVPVQVSLLDYAGFEMQALLHMTVIDWSAVQSTADEAWKHWKVIESRVADKGLHAAVNTTIVGMQKTALTRNAEMAGFAAQIDLDLVDLLEGYFERTVK
jgi:hypothetical protein